MPQLKWKESPIRTVGEAQRHFKLIRPDESEREVFRVCFEAAVAVYKHVSSQRPAEKRLKKLSDDFAEMVKVFQESYPEELGGISDIRESEVLRDKLEGYFLSGWKKKFSAEQRPSEQGVQELADFSLAAKTIFHERMHPTTHAGPAPEYMVHIRALRRSLNKEIDGHAYAWVRKFDTEAWAAKIVANHSLAPNAAPNGLRDALEYLTYRFLINDQKDIAHMLVPIVACACATLQLEPCAADEFAIFLVALDDSQVEGPAFTDAQGKDGETTWDKSEAKDKADRATLKTFKVRQDKWRQQFRKWGPADTRKVAGESDEDILERMELLNKLSPDDLEDFVRRVGELPPRSPGEDYTAFLGRVAQLLVAPNVDDDGEARKSPGSTDDDE
jgi:hypothetical protein|tara:strand:- start:624 stop:1784 length:1161 start_codon:yes stop_codon:yes gene_type:complete